MNEGMQCQIKCVFCFVLLQKLNNYIEGDFLIEIYKYLNVMKKQRCLFLNYIMFDVLIVVRMVIWEVEIIVFCEI